MREDKERPTCRRNTYYYFTNFCDSTSIHGFKFVGEQGRYWIEKVWWVIIVVAAFSGAIALIHQSYMKWVTTPILVSFSTVEKRISEIPFPAVTICSEIKVKARIFNYTENYFKLRNNKPLTKKEKDYYDVFSLMCDYGREYGSRSFPALHLLEFEDKFYQPTILDPKWAGTEINDTETLRYMFTQEGWCVSFNNLRGSDFYKEYNETESNSLKKSKGWSLQNGYDDQDNDVYPSRATVSGLQAGFQIDLNIEHEDIDNVCSELDGFKVVLHHPGEAPDMDSHFRVPLDQMVIAGISPRMIIASDQIKKYDVSKRGCYFEGEKQLRYFKTYTQTNCMAECIHNVTQVTFDCVELPNLPFLEDNDTVCGAAQLEEIKLAQNSFIKQLAMSDLGDTYGECYCLPACTSLEFDAETSQNPWNWKRRHELGLLKLINEDASKNHVSRLIVYYKNFQFIATERNQLYGVVDFLASCGGFVGLFCGFSFTSVMEILYYLTLRLVCNFKKYGRRVWSGAPELRHSN